MTRVTVRKIIDPALRGADRMARSLIFIVLMLLAPVMVYRTQTEIKVDPGAAKAVLIDELGGEGEWLDIRMGKTVRSMTEVLPGKILITAGFVMGAGMISLLFALALGLVLPANSAGFRELARFLGIFPDFILVLLFQRAAVLLAGIFGTTVFRTAWVNPTKPALFLPLAVLVVIGGTQLANGIGLEKAKLEKSDFVMFARARGLGEGRILFRHILPGILKNLRPELVTLLSLITGNMFILERMLNIPGLTRFMFSYIFLTDYNYFTYNETLKIQFLLGGVSLLSLMGIFLTCYHILLGICLLIAKGLDR